MRNNQMGSKTTVVYGVHAVETLVRERGFYENDELYISRNDQRLRQLLQKANKNNIQVRRVSPGEIEKRCGSERHQGVALVFDGDLSPPELTKEDLDKPGIFVALDNIQDPQNLGAIIRTMEALGARGLILPRHESAPLTEAVLKVSSGAMLHLPVMFTGKIAAFLNNIKDKNICVVGASLDGERLTADGARDIVSQYETVVLVLGSEQKGIAPLAKKRCQRLFKIEQRGKTESLNVSASAAIFLHQFLTALGEQGAR